MIRRTQAILGAICVIGGCFYFGVSMFDHAIFMVAVGIYAELCGKDRP